MSQDQSSVPATSFDPYHRRETLPPPLPDLIPDPEIDAVEGATGGGDRWKPMPEGCHFVTYTPRQLGERATQIVEFLGTLRVERAEHGTLASGDLYYFVGAGDSRPLPSHGIPVFPRENTRLYLRVTDVSASSRTLRLVFDGYEYFDQRWWIRRDSFTARLDRQEAPPDYPRPDRYWSGELRDSSGALRGDFSMGWVSPYLRRATLELRREQEAPFPGSEQDIGADNLHPIDDADFHRVDDENDHRNLRATWQATFAAVDWELDVVPSEDAFLDEPPDGTWSYTRLHRQLVELRRDTSPSGDPDQEWLYRLLCVRRIAGDVSGVMFDAPSFDCNGLPREGAAIASQTPVPPAGRFGNPQIFPIPPTTAEVPELYFRSAVHEIGHALNQDHREGSRHNGFMTTTGRIAANAGAGSEFPRNVELAFAPDDQKRIRHWPDLWVRPGGIAFGLGSDSQSIFDREPERIAGLVLEVTPIPAHGFVPLGAPVRVEFRLRDDRDPNVPQRPVPVPSLSLKDRHVRTIVIGPEGTARDIYPLTLNLDPKQLEIPVDAVPETTLQPGESVRHALTLLHGNDGPLFAGPGLHRVAVELSWQLAGREVQIAGETQVCIGAATQQKHACAAIEVLTSAQALSVIAVGGNHLQQGVAALRAALDVGVLRHHYEFIEAKRLINLGEFDALPEISPRTVMTVAEVRRGSDLIRRLDELGRAEDFIPLIRELKRRIRAAKGADRGPGQA